MTALGQRDVRAALDLVYEAHSAGSPEEMAVRVVERLPDVVDCDQCSWNEMLGKPGEQSISFLCNPADAVWPGSEELLAAYSSDHPLISYYEKTCDGRALKISDFLSGRQFHSSAIYREVYRHLEVEAQIAVALPLPAGHFVGIALCSRGPDFTEEDRDLLEVLRPHLAQALEHNLLRSRAAKPLARLRGYGLTQREAEVLTLVSAGATNYQVGRRLGVSPRTVQRHMEAVFAKLGVHTRTAAAAIVHGDSCP